MLCIRHYFDIILACSKGSVLLSIVSSSLLSGLAMCTRVALDILYPGAQPGGHCAMALPLVPDKIMHKINFF